MSKRTPLRIPSKVSIGKDRYAIQHMENMKCLGMIHYDENLIQIAIKSYNRRCFIEEREETFLHELTHGILYAMEHPLARSEVFVTKFSRLLHKALTTARY